MTILEKLKGGLILDEINEKLQQAGQAVTSSAYALKKNHTVTVKITLSADTKERDHVKVKYSVGLKLGELNRKCLTLVRSDPDQNGEWLEEQRPPKGKDAAIIPLKKAHDEGEQLKFADSDEEVENE